MKTIFKYDFQITDRQHISMPVGAVILDAQIQNGVPVMWALVDTDAKIQEREFWIFGTGRPVSIDLSQYSHVSTFQHDVYVWHLFVRVA